MISSKSLIALAAGLLLPAPLCADSPVFTSGTGTIAITARLFPGGGKDTWSTSVGYQTFVASENIAPGNPDQLPFGYNITTVHANPTDPDPIQVIFSPPSGSGIFQPGDYAIPAQGVVQLRDAVAGQLERPVCESAADSNS